MGFIRFLGRIARISVGYLGGFLLMATGSLSLSSGNKLTGIVVFVIGAVLALYGVYNDRQL
jgi:hypothetical protein